MGLWRRHLLAMDTRGLRLDLRLLARSKRGAGGDPSQTLFPIMPEIYDRDCRRQQANTLVLLQNSAPRASHWRPFPQSLVDERPTNENFTSRMPPCSLEVVVNKGVREVLGRRGKAWTSYQEGPENGLDAPRNSDGRRRWNCGACRRLFFAAACRRAGRNG